MSISSQLKKTKTPFFLVFFLVTCNAPSFPVSGGSIDYLVWLALDLLARFPQSHGWSSWRCDSDSSPERDFTLAHFPPLKNDANEGKGISPLPSQARRIFGEESEARGCGRLKTDSHFVGRLSLGDLQIVLKCSNFPDLGVLCC